jgi:hypothetical protein
MECYKRGGQHSIWLREIIWYYPRWRGKENSKEATLSRTIKTLFKKKCIILLKRNIYSKDFVGAINKELHKGVLSEYRQMKKMGAGFLWIENEDDLIDSRSAKTKIIKLTDNGIKLAKSLMLSNDNLLKLND